MASTVKEVFDDAVEGLQDIVARGLYVDGEFADDATQRTGDSTLNSYESTLNSYESQGHEPNNTSMREAAGNGSGRKVRD
eukprot:CAMPEP_0196187430 /NCGR_PEP_ID=MMETSP0911-20130528/40358_1 /TAXON_ID=49265 /ORGANISM="Thalassiosira rotula, Strain GSO102" /LENGTH=79 /DNA_ID=CAMNT_0041458521 /DNA_START=35 /DNA_END=271 /DNA_ORIENTATION=-